jgi:hypothetical protein
MMSDANLIKDNDEPNENEDEKKRDQSLYEIMHTQNLTISSLLFLSLLSSLELTYSFTFDLFRVRTSLDDVKNDISTQLQMNQTNSTANTNQQNAKTEWNEKHQNNIETNNITNDQIHEEQEQDREQEETQFQQGNDKTSEKSTRDVFDTEMWTTLVNEAQYKDINAARPIYEVIFSFSFFHSLFLIFRSHSQTLIHLSTRFHSYLTFILILILIF